MAAFDIDPLAVGAAAENAARNGVALAVARADVLADPLPPAPLWIANLELGLLRRLLERPDLPPVILASGLLDPETVGGGERVVVRRLGGRAGAAVTRHAYRFFAARGHGRGRASSATRDRRHLEQVLRLRVGDTCEVAAGGRVYRARVTAGGLELLEEIDVVTAPPVTVWLAQPGGRSDDGGREADRARRGPDRRAAHASCSRASSPMRASSAGGASPTAAAKQSKQAQVPEVLPVADYADVLSPEAVVLSHTGASGGLADRIVGRRAATLLIGPEPGFSEAELELARSRGVAVATFGPVVLRTETAAIVAAALALREMGFLG